MAERLSSIQFEDIPIDEARRMTRGPRMDPQLYQELKKRIPALTSHAVHMTIPVVLNRLCCNLREIVVADEILDSADMIGQLFGE
jgi:hypothetical protein